MKITIRRERLTWHEGKEKLRLMHLSDFHLKWMGRRIPRIEAAIAEEKPDLVVMTGDYWDTPRGGRLFAAFLERVAAVVPVCWILGNHDRWFGSGLIDKLVQIPAAHCVDNQSAEFMSTRGFRYQLVSWKDHQQSRSSSAEGERRIVLLHNPREITEEHLHSCDMVLAGHLHGGQFILGRSATGDFFPGCLLYRWCGDRYEVQGSTIIVSRGLGDTLPLRFRCPHEVVVIDID